MEIIIYAGILILLGVMILKVWNVIGRARNYEPIWIFIGFAVALIFWYMAFTSYLSLTLFEKSATVDNGSTITTIVQTSNNYAIYTPLIYLAHFLVGIIMMLTIIEVISLFSILPTMPKKAKSFSN